MGQNVLVNMGGGGGDSAHPVAFEFVNLLRPNLAQW